MGRIMLYIIISGSLLLIPRCNADDDKDKDKDKEKDKELDPYDIKSAEGAWVPAFVYRNVKNYEKYGPNTTIQQKEAFIDLLNTTRSLGDVIVFEEQCVNDAEYKDLKNISDVLLTFYNRTNENKRRIIVIKIEDLKNPLDMLMENTLGVDFTARDNIRTTKNVTVKYPYVTRKRNELQISSNNTIHYMLNHIKGFVSKYESDYHGDKSYSGGFKPLVVHYTWVRFHMHDWPSEQTPEDRKAKQKKHFKIVFDRFITETIQQTTKKENTFLIYASNQTYCHRAQLKNPREIWTMEDKRWGSTSIWCRTNHILLQVADLTVMYPNEIMVKPKGARYCETTVYREHMVVVLRIDQYSHDVDLYFDIKLPSRKDKYRTYTVERAYLENRKEQGHEFNRRVRVGNTFYNKFNRIVLRKACPRNGALVLGTIGLEYLPSDDTKNITEYFSNQTARRIVFIVEGGLQDYCRVKKVFDWMAFAKRITVIMILIALPFAILLFLAMLIIRFRFQLFRCTMCLWGLAVTFWKRSKPARRRMLEMAEASPQTLKNTFNNAKSSDVTYCCYKCIMLLHPKNIARGCQASGRGVKRLCTPVGHLIGIGAYLLQRCIYNMCVKVGGVHPGPGRSFTARLGRAREYTAQHIGNVAIYFIQGMVTISVVRAIALVATTLLEIS